MQNIHKLIRNC